jgi:hypothetical protein
MFTNKNIPHPNKIAIRISICLPNPNPQYSPKNHDYFNFPLYVYRKHLHAPKSKIPQLISKRGLLYNKGKGTGLYMLSVYGSLFKPGASDLVLMC